MTFLTTLECMVVLLLVWSISGGTWTLKFSCGYAMVDCCRFSATCLSPLINRKHIIKDCTVTVLLSAPTDVKRPFPVLCPLTLQNKEESTKATPFPPPAKVLCKGCGTIYIGDFSALCEHLNESTIFQYFSEYGPVAVVELPRPYIDSYLSFKWALVRFIDPDDADAVVKVGPHYIGGVPVTVHPQTSDCCKS